MRITSVCLFISATLLGACHAGASPKPHASGETVASIRARAHQEIAKRDALIANLLAQVQSLSREVAQLRTGSGSGAVVATDEADRPFVRYDGLYTLVSRAPGTASATVPGAPSPPDNSPALAPGGYYEYFRFYADGTVVYVSSPDTPNEIAGWFSRYNRMLPRGIFRLSGHSITFSLINAQGTVDYQGTAQGDDLSLESNNHISGNTGRHEIHFIKMDSPAFLSTK